LPFCLRSTWTIIARSNDGNKRTSDVTYWINYILSRQNTTHTAASESVDNCSVFRIISSSIECRWTDEFCVNIKRVQWTKTTNRSGCDGRVVCACVSSDSTIISMRHKPVTTTAKSSSRVVWLALTHSMMMIDTNQEKASKIEQKLLITITSTVNVKTVLR
jgi:hypothetical protein